MAHSVNTSFTGRAAMLRVYVTLWVLLVIVTGIHCYPMLLAGESDVLLESQEAISSVLQDSWIPRCSIVYVIDGFTSSATLYQLFERHKLESNVGVFEISPKSQNSGNLTRYLDVLYKINQIRKSSWCLTMVVASDTDDFLSVVVDEAVNNDVLIWPTRLLVVTRLPGSRLGRLRESFSAVNAMVLILQKTSRTKRCSVYMYLPYTHQLVLVASWSPNYGLRYLVDHQLFPDKFRKFTGGAHLKVVGQTQPPHVIVRKLETGGDGDPGLVFTGPLVRLLDVIAHNVNFTYTLLLPPDRSWGYRFPNGTWNGMIGMVKRKEVDFALGTFATTYIRSQVIDYTNPLVIDYGRILGRRGDTEIDPWSFAMPFTPSVWIGTLVALIFILAFLMATYRADWELSQVSPKVSLATYIRTLLQQDIVVPSSSVWERVMLGFWMLTAFILIKSYSSNLMSLLAVRYISEPYQTIKDMVDDPKLIMLWFGNSAYTQHLSTVKEGIFREVAEAGEQGRIKLITPADFVFRVDQLISQGDHVMVNPFLSMKGFLTENYMDKGNCKYYVSRENFLPLTFSMVIQKYSPLKGPINEGIRAMIEGGIYNDWLDKAVSNARSCKNPPTKITVKVSLSLTNLWGMFVVLIIGYTISIIALCLEVASWTLR